MIHWKCNHANNNNEVRQGTSGIYLSFDPAPPLESDKPVTDAAMTSEPTDNTCFPHVFRPLTVVDLREILMDPSKSLFERYRAMFSLRNINTDASAMAIADSFVDTSALFRHEVAYVLGQMQRPVTIPPLTTVLQNHTEHKMVRHEAAEALGAIGGNAVEVLLQQYIQDTEDVVRESAEVALDAMDYWSNFEHQ